MDAPAASPPARFAEAATIEPRLHGSVERSRARDLGHGAVLGIGWATIAVLWVRVLRGTSGEVLALAGSTVAVAAVVTVGLTLWWISHNLAIHRRKGPRTGTPTLDLVYDRDWVGRAVTADWACVRDARIVVVCASDRRKVLLADPSVEAIDDGLEATRHAWTAP